MSAAVNFKLSVSGAAQAERDIGRVGAAVETVPAKMGAGVSAIGAQISRLQNLWIGLQGLQFFGVGLRELAGMADAFTGLNARLALATGSTQSASAQFGRLLGIANQMQQPIGEVGQLYISLARSADNLGASQQDMTRFTEGVAASLRVSGTSSQAAAGALQQLSQAMAGSTVQAEEFNSLIDGAPELLRTVAAGLGTAGVSMGELRDRVRSGKLGTQEFFEAFLKGSDALVDKARGLPPTIGGAFTELSNNAMAGIGALDRAMGGASQNIARGIQAVAGAIPALADGLGKTLSLAGIAFVSGTLKGWETIKFGAASAWAAIKAAWRATLEGMGGVLGWFLDTLAGGLESLGLDSAAGKLRGWAAGVVASTRSAQSLADELGALRKEYDAATGQIDEITGEMADEAIASFAAEKAHEAQAAEVRKLTDAKAKLSDAQNKLLGDFGKELDKLREANATFGMGEDAVLAYRAAKDGLARQTQGLRDAIAAERAELQRKTDVERAAKELAAELIKTRVEQAGALLDEGQAVAEQVRKLQEETLQMGMAKDQLQALERQRLADAVATAEQRLQTALAAGVRGEELDGITLMVEELRRLKQAKEEGWAKAAAIEARDAAKDAADEWGKTVASIEGGLTDALMRAFESGKGFMDAFKSTLVNAFKTMVLQPTIRAIMAPISGAAGSLFSTGAQAAGGGGEGGGGMLGSLAGGGGMLGSVGAFGAALGSGGSALMAGGWGQVGQAMGAYSSAGMGATAAGIGAGAAATALGGFMAGRGIGQAISGGYSAFGGSGNAASNIGAVIGALWGPLGSMLGGAIGGAVNRLFGRKLKDSGIEGTLSTEGMEGNSFQFYKGGLFRSNKTKRGELDAGIDSVFDAGIGAASAQVSAYVQALGLPVAALKGYSEQIKISFKDLSEEQVQQAIADAINKFQGGLASLYTGAIDQYQKAGETALQTLQRLATLQAFSDTINQFGGAFSAIAQLGIDARESLIGMAGGIEALLGKTRQFVADYYTEGEQAALSARDVFKALSSTGMNLGGLDTKAEYRALLESRDLGTEAGRAQFAALLDASTAFAQLAPYLEKSGQTLDALAQIAPRMAELETLFAPGTQADGTAADLQLGLSDVSQSVADGSADVVGAIRDMRDAVLGGLATVAGNTATSANYLRDLYDVNAYGGGA